MCTVYIVISDLTWIEWKACGQWPKSVLNLHLDQGRKQQKATKSPSGMTDGWKGYHQTKLHSACFNLAWRKNREFSQAGWKATHAVNDYQSSTERRSLNSSSYGLLSLKYALKPAGWNFLHSTRIGNRHGQERISALFRITPPSTGTQFGK